jgi:hypothetical protein
MGFVCNVLLSFDDEEWWEDGEDQPRTTCEPLRRINQWIPHGKLVDLTRQTYAARAGAGMDANLFGGGYKQFDIDQFIEIVEAQAWKRRTKVQLWVKGTDEVFTAIRLRPRMRRRQPVSKTGPKPRRRSAG